MAIDVRTYGTVEHYTVCVTCDHDGTSETLICKWPAYLNASALGGLLRSLDVAIEENSIRRALGRKVKPRKPD